MVAQDTLLLQVLKVVVVDTGAVIHHNVMVVKVMVDHHTSQA